MEPADSTAQTDVTIIDVRHFDDKVIQDLKSDRELNYSADRATISLWERMWRWLAQLINALFSETASTDWGRFAIYVIAVVILTYVIMRVMKIDAFNLFAGKNTGAADYTVLDENIHEMNFEKLISEALSKKDYRLVIRLFFLHSLKLLSDKQLIHWEPGKTNVDYQNELQVAELKKGFNELGFYFQYAWYGNFAVSDEMLARVKEKYTDWKTKL
ncbi:MAG: hypothetical protein ACOYXT_09630 [Bacteroidota bacterium]